MRKKLLVLLALLVVVLAGCKKVENDKIVTDEPVVNETNSDISQNEEDDIKISSVREKDNRVIIEKDYYNFLNYDGTYLFRERYDLDGTYYYTYYRVNSNGDILNIYDDSIIDMSEFNVHGQNVASIERKSKAPGKSDLVPMMGIIDINGNWIVEEATRILSFRDNFYVVLYEEFDDFGSIGFKPTIINNENKVLMELPLEENLSSDNYIGSNSWSTSDYNGFVFSNEFFYHNNEIITYDGNIIELNSSTDDIEKIGSTENCVTIEKKDKILIVNENGIISQIEKHPNMVDIRIYSKDTYSYFNLDNDNIILVHEGKEVPLDFEYEWFHVQLTEQNIPILMFKLANDRYKLSTIENGSMVDISKEYFSLDFDSFGYVRARETRENGTGGFYTILNYEGEEVISRDSKIIEMTSDLTGYVTVRINDNNEARRYINWATLELYDRDHLRELFLQNLSKLNNM